MLRDRHRGTRILQFVSLFCSVFSSLSQLLAYSPRATPLQMLHWEFTGVAAMKSQQPLIEFYTRPPKQSSVFLASRNPCKFQLVHPDHSWLITFELSIPLFASLLFQCPSIIVYTLLFFNWSIVDLQYCAGFRGTAKWFSYIHIYFSDYFPL